MRPLTVFLFSHPATRSSPSSFSFFASNESSFLPCACLHVSVLQVLHVLSVPEIRFLPLPILVSLASLASFPRSTPAAPLSQSFPSLPLATTCLLVPSSTLLLALLLLWTRNRFSCAISCHSRCRVRRIRIMALFCPSPCDSDSVSHSVTCLSFSLSPSLCLSRCLESCLCSGRRSLFIAHRSLSPSHPLIPRSSCELAMIPLSCVFCLSFNFSSSRPLFRGPSFLFNSFLAA